MEDVKILFKTNINCGGCISSIKPHLDNTSAIQEWSVDTNNKDKILSVSTTLTAEQVIAIVNKAGYKAEALS